MTHTDAVIRIANTIKQVQEASGRTSVDVTTKTRPFLDIDGFDSMSGMEALVILSEALNVELPETTFLVEAGESSPTVSEIADSLCKTLGERPT